MEIKVVGPVCPKWQMVEKKKYFKKINTKFFSEVSL